MNATKGSIFFVQWMQWMTVVLTSWKNLNRMSLYHYMFFFVFQNRFILCGAVAVVVLVLIIIVAVLIYKNLATSSWSTRFVVFFIFYKLFCPNVPGLKCLLKNTVFYSGLDNFLYIFFFILEEADVNWMFSGGYSDHCYYTSGRVRLGHLLHHRP